MRVGDEQIVDKVLVFDLGCGTSAATAFLRLVDIDRLCLGVAAVRQRDDDLLARDQIFNAEIAVILNDFGAALIAKCLSDFCKLIPNNLQQRIRVRKNTRKSLILSSISLYSLIIFSCSSPVRRCSLKSRMACACTAKAGTGHQPCQTLLQAHRAAYLSARLARAFRSLNRAPSVVHQSALWPQQATATP